MNDQLPQVGECVCGRPIPAGSPSDWACSEVCQAAWTHHHADPAYPHPRQIRAAVEARQGELSAAGRATPAVVGELDAGDGISVGGRRFVRVGGHWQPDGMWTPADAGLADRAGYRRWCPRCQSRRTAVTVSGPPGSTHATGQLCAACDHHWPGLPLTGVLEQRGRPWPGLRMRLSDGQRSVTAWFTAAQMDDDRIVERINSGWLPLERQLCGGYADADQPDQHQLQRRQRRLDRGWHLHLDLS